jgi:hypothetical protein
MFNFTDAVTSMADLLARSHITVYSIEPRGLDHFVTTRKGEIEFAEHGTMDTIASLTGGKNFHNTNGMTEALAEAIDTGANFYTITYTPANQKVDTHFRTITVKVDQPGLRLTYRNGYYASDPDTTLAGRKIVKRTAIQSAMVRGSPDATQVRFKVNVAQARGSEDTLPAGNQASGKLKPPYRRYMLSFSVDVNGIDFATSPDGNYRGDFEFGVMVYEANGEEVLNSALKRVNPILPPAVYQSMRRGGANAHLEVAVPATGEFVLRIAVHDLTSDRIGALEVPTGAITVSPAP